MCLRFLEFSEPMRWVVWFQDLEMKRSGEEGIYIEVFLEQQSRMNKHDFEGEKQNESGAQTKLPIVVDKDSTEAKHLSYFPP